MLQRDVTHSDLWKEIRQYERNAKADDLLWRFLHSKVKVGSEIDWLMPEKQCPTCRTPKGEQVLLTLEHVWIECEAARQVWDLFGSVWEVLQGEKPRFLPSSRDTLIALFAKSHWSVAGKRRWIMLYTSAVWEVWRAYLDSSIDDAEFHPTQVRVRYWDELCKIIRREKILALNPRYQAIGRHSEELFERTWKAKAQSISLKHPPRCLTGLRLQT